MCRVGWFMTHTQESTLGTKCTFLFLKKNTIYCSSCKVIVYFTFWKDILYSVKMKDLLPHYTVYLKYVLSWLQVWALGGKDSNQGANKCCFTHHYLDENCCRTNGSRFSAFNPLFILLLSLCTDTTYVWALLISLNKSFPPPPSLFGYM